MAKRTSPRDAEGVETADDLELIVHDKREGWRASGAKARRRQRRYKNLLTQALVKIGTSAGLDEMLDDETGD